MKVTLKGIVTKFGEVKEIKGANGNPDTTIQEIILQKKSFNTETGELRSDDVFPIQIWGKDLTLFNAAYSLSSKMEIDCYLNGKKYTKEGTTDEKYFLSLTGKAFRTVK